MNNSHDTFGLIEVNGEKAIPFLQGQLSANINLLQPDRALFAVHCNPKGRILCSFILFQHQQVCYLFTVKSNLAKIISYLNRYAALFRVSLRDQSDAFTLHFGLNNNPSESIWDWTVQATENSMLISNNQLVLQLMRQAKDFSSEKAPLQMTIEITATQWHGHLLRLGFPWINERTWEQFLPHELGLQHTPVISFDKGCYTGQEIITRLHYKGRAKRHTRLFLITNHSFILDANKGFYTDIDRTSEVILVDYAEYQCKTLIVLLCNIDLSPFHNVYLSDGSILSLSPLD